MTIDPPAGMAALSLPDKCRTFAADIKFSHTVFAMPWAILAAVMAWEIVRGPLAGKLALVVVCMVAARTVAMVSNRLLDAGIDAKNPRTALRAVPSGKLSRSFMAAVLCLCSVVFIVATAAFWLVYGNHWPLVLSAPVLLFVSAYPLLKRFTRLCHYYLGAALALAPVCAWVAIAGSMTWPPIIMALAVLTWTAGFDIIYACQDYDCDVRDGISSVPAKMGIARALWVSRLTHVACVALLITLGVLSEQLGALYFVGVACAGLLLVVEHAIVKPHDLSKVGLAFFTINGIVSLLLGTMGVVDVLIG
ncbi:MAG TPA: UbiA-like polyprenyltransferase [Tepidisphaeraceae bacterium]|nr:UbiA-like polyprenyltransferase [Tepidisphaeraceae bacterium]